MAKLVICKKLTDFEDKVFYFVIKESYNARSFYYEIYSGTYQTIVSGITNLKDTNAIIKKLVNDNDNIALPVDNLDEHIEDIKYDNFSKEKYLYINEHKDDNEVENTDNTSDTI